MVIQMKLRQQYIYMVTFIFKYFTKWNLGFVLNFAFRHLGVKGLRLKVRNIYQFALKVPFFSRKTRRQRNDGNDDFPVELSNARFSLTWIPCTEFCLTPFLELSLLYPKTLLPHHLPPPHLLVSSKFIRNLKLCSENGKLGCKEKVKLGEKK